MSNLIFSDKLPHQPHIRFTVDMQRRLEIKDCENGIGFYLEESEANILANMRMMTRAELLCSGFMISREQDGIRLRALFPVDASLTINLSEPPYVGHLVQMFEDIAHAIVEQEALDETNR